jgi:GNAT superfamily N-acetyltransferase
VRSVKRWTLGAGGVQGSVELSPAPADVAGVLSRPGYRLCFLSHLYLHPSLRGKGYSEPLLKAALGWADRYGYDVWLYCAPYGPARVRGKAVRQNVTALKRLYRRWGFRHTRAACYENAMVRRCSSPPKQP